MKILKYAPIPPKVANQEGDIKFIHQTIDPNEHYQSPIQFYPGKNKNKKSYGKVMKNNIK